MLTLKWKTQLWHYVTQEEEIMILYLKATFVLGILVYAFWQTKWSIQIPEDENIFVLQIVQQMAVKIYAMQKTYCFTAVVRSIVWVP